MKVLVIPDIHNKIRLVDAIIKQEGDVDKCVFLGDIWDDFHDTPHIATEVAQWVKSRILDNRFVFLWGNHDLGYGFKNRNLMCSGYELEKDMAIWRVLNKDHFSRWKFYWFVQGFLLSHGGLHPNFLPPVWKESDITTQNLKDYLSKEEEKCKVVLDMDGGHHWFFLPGDARFRPKRGVEAGGLVWCDAREEFVPVPRLAQVFGHTPNREWPVVIYGDTGLGRVSGPEVTKIGIEAKDHWNVALDCHLKFYAVIRDGILRIKQSPSL